MKREDLDTHTHRLISKPREFFRHIWSEENTESLSGQYRISSKSQSNRAGTAFCLLQRHS
jgi:hypothetical protein